MKRSERGGKRWCTCNVLVRRESLRDTLHKMRSWEEQDRVTYQLVSEAEVSPPQLALLLSSH